MIEADKLSPTEKFLRKPTCLQIRTRYEHANGIFIRRQEELVRLFDTAGKVEREIAAETRDEAKAFLERRWKRIRTELLDHADSYRESALQREAIRAEYEARACSRLLGPLDTF